MVLQVPLQPGLELDCSLAWAQLGPLLETRTATGFKLEQASGLQATEPGARRFSRNTRRSVLFCSDRFKPQGEKTFEAGKNVNELIKV